jgi:hypothetical protein
MELIFKNGNMVLPKHIPYDKDCLGKVRLTRSGCSEGIWVAFSAEDKVRYDNDDLRGEYVIGVVCNDTLCGVPWGAYLKVELMGDERPVSVCEEVFGDTPTFTIADWAAASTCESIMKSLSGGEYKLEDAGVRDYIILMLKTAPESDVTEALKQLLEQ